MGDELDLWTQGSAAEQGTHGWLNTGNALVTGKRLLGAKDMDREHIPARPDT